MCRKIPRSIIIALRLYLLYTTRMNVPAWRLTCKLENRNIRELHWVGQIWKLWRTYSRREKEKGENLKTNCVRPDQLQQMSK